MLRASLLVCLGLTACALAGCGGVKLVPVEGTVKLDGKPVDGATVTFISDDGKWTAFGTTDSSGHFSLQSGDKAGTLPGNYKVTVVKSPNKATEGNLDPNEAMKQMKKDQEEANKAQKSKAGSGGGSDPMSKMKMGGGGGPGGGLGAAPGVEKTELPTIYAAGTTTTLTATVPAAGAPAVELELKSTKGK